MNLNNQKLEFLKHLEGQGKSFNTIKNYKTDLNLFGDYWLERKKSSNINEFTLKEVEEYAHYLDQKYSSENSKRRRVQALRLFFDYLVSNDLFPENPVRKIGAFAKVLDKPNPVPFPLIQKMVKDFSEHKNDNKLYHRNLVLIGLIYGAGLKVSDIAKLKTKHILKGKNLRVMVSRNKRDPYSVPLSSFWSEVLTEYLDCLPSYQNESGLHFDHLLFNANAYQILSGGLSSRGIELIFKELSTKYKTKMTARSLRQSCLFKWMLMQVPESTIKEWMGVQPVYSLKPFKDLLSENPAEFAFNEF